MKQDHRYNLWYPDRMRLPVILALTAAADFLLYGPFVSGSIPRTALYLLLIFALLPERRNFLSRPARILWYTQLGLCAAGIFLYAGAFPVLLGYCSLLLFRAVCREERADTSVLHWIRNVLILVFSLPFDAFYQLREWRRRIEEHRDSFSGIGKGLLLWCLPVLGSLFFLSLFAEANPVFERGLNRVKDWLVSFEFFSGGRIAFWMLSVLFAAFATGLSIWKRLLEKIAPEFAAIGWKEPSPASIRTLAAVMTRGLLLFNIVFLIQNLLDVEYLWAGAALPEALSYAEYAHRGAYPLIATALIAGILTLLTFSGTCSGPDWKWARRLVYLWLGQNVFLVASSLLRLEKYIAVYSLTGLRVAAALWMLIVGIGLCLILCKILRGKSLRWLFWANGVQVLIVLLFVMFADTSRFIAEYNVRHCREVVGKTAEGLSPAPLDVKYLQTLLPASLPVLLRVQEMGLPYSFGNRLRNETEQLERSVSHWRTWRLSNSLILREIRASTEKSQNSIHAENPLY